MGGPRVRSAYPGYTPSRVARTRPKVASGNIARPDVPSSTHIPAASPEATLMGGPRVLHAEPGSPDKAEGRIRGTLRGHGMPSNTCTRAASPGATPTGGHP